MRVVIAILICLIALTATGIRAAEDSEKRSIEDLPERWRVWLQEEVYPLITKEQKRAFLSLDTEAQRFAFAERLWILWGRQSGLGSSFRSVYDYRLSFARSEFDSTNSDRARVLLIHGPPAFRLESKCTEFFHPMDIWGWPYLEGMGEDVVVVFYQVGGVGKYRMWNPIMGRRALASVMRGAEWGALSGSGARLDSPRFRCPDGQNLMNLIAVAEFWARDAGYISGMTYFKHRERYGPESTSTRFMEFSALLDKKAEPLDFSLQEESWGSRGGLVHMSFAVNVDSEGLGDTAVGDVPVIQLDVIGEITRRAQMVDRFRYVFSVPATGTDPGLRFERFIRPGDYQLRLKVEDVHSNKAGISEFSFSASPEPTGTLPGDQFMEELEEIEAMVTADIAGGEADEQPILDLVGPEGEAISGIQRFEAVTREEVRRVSFLVNDELVLTKNRPPFDVDLNLGPQPRLTTVMAVGFDRHGEELARDAISMNVARERFFLRLQPVSSARSSSGEVKVGVDVNVPSEMSLDRLEFSWNEAVIATIEKPPWEAWVKLEGGGEFGYLRAVATMGDGSVAEDFQFVNAPEFGTVVDVTGVELPVTVLDREGRPVENLKQDDFSVLEDEVAQIISHFALHQDLPVRLGIVVDTSGSMTETLPTVQRVVMGFLRDLLRPQDRAFVETFSDKPDVLASFTADFQTLENAMLSLFADRATALYDAVITGLFQFSGVRGRKSMVVLTDGEDTASENGFDDVLGYAQRAGVTIYVIGVDLPATKFLARRQLSKLAQVTGGRAFYVSKDSELERIYSNIDRELRTQYLLAYTSSSEKDPEELRKIKVEVDRPRVKVRTISGYYPGGI